MFYKDGWFPLAEVARLVETAALREHWGRDDVATLFSVEAFALARREAAKLIGALTQVAVLLPTGQTVNASRELLRGLGEEDRSGNEHLSVFVGTVGSGLHPYEEESYEDVSLKFLQIFYGPFVGCPVLLKDTEVEQAITSRFGISLPEIRAIRQKIPISTFEREEEHRRVQGRPKRGEGLVEKAARNHFRQQYSSGIPRGQSEAVVQEMIEWADAILEEKVSRSTMRRYLKLGASEGP